MEDVSKQMRVRPSKNISPERRILLLFMSNCTGWTFISSQRKTWRKERRTEAKTNTSGMIFCGQTSSNLNYSETRLVWWILPCVRGRVRKMWGRLKKIFSWSNTFGNVDLKFYHGILWYYRNNDKSGDNNYWLLLFLVTVWPWPHGIATKHFMKWKTFPFVTRFFKNQSHEKVWFELLSSTQ